MITQKHMDNTMATISIVIGFDDRLPGFGDGKIPLVVSFLVFVVGSLAGCTVGLTEAAFAVVTAVVFVCVVLVGDKLVAGLPWHRLQPKISNLMHTGFSFKNGSILKYLAQSGGSKLILSSNLVSFSFN